MRKQSSSIVRGRMGKAIARAIAGISFVTLGQVTASADELTNKATIQRAFDTWADGSGSPYDLLADGAKWTITGNSLVSKTYGSRDAFITEVIRPFNARMSVGLKPVIRNIYADGDTVVVFFDASGTARDGKPYANTYAWIIDLKDGRIVNASAFFDSIAFNDLWTRVPVSTAQ